MFYNNLYYWLRGEEEDRSRVCRSLAAYDTVWREGLLYKVAKIIKDRKILKLISYMTGARKFFVCLGDKQSGIHEQKNGVPQGSVIAPTLFNIYIGDLPDTSAWKLGYADDWVVVSQSDNFDALEDSLSEDMNELATYFGKWYLKMNTGKTVATTFHLDNKQANRIINVKINNTSLPTEQSPTYLGVTLDRSLTFKPHLTNSSSKLKKRASIIKKLAGTTWGARQDVLRTSAIALCYSVAEYCAPAWARSVHTYKVDVILNDVMRTIAGSIKSTPLAWLPTLSNIAPPDIRRQQATQNLHLKIESLDPRAPIKIILESAPSSTRLVSRRPFYKTQQTGFNAADSWRAAWSGELPVGGGVVEDPTRPLPGFSDGTRTQWLTRNRLLTRHGRTLECLHRWGTVESPLCNRCGEAPQTTDHIVLHCPHTAIDGGYYALYCFGEEFRSWMMQTDVRV